MNLNKSQMHQRCPNARPLEARTLVNWKLCFKGVADIFPFEGSIGLSAGIPDDRTAIWLIRFVAQDCAQLHRHFKQ